MADNGSDPFPLGIFTMADNGSYPFQELSRDLLADNGSDPFPELSRDFFVMASLFSAAIVVMLPVNISFLINF